MQKRFNKTVKLPSIAICLAFGLSVYASEPFPLKDITNSVDKLLTAEKPDLSEFGYLTARGAALYMTMAAVFEENGNRDEKDQKMVRDYRDLSQKYLKVSIALNSKAEKSDKAIKEQFDMLIDAYSKEMVRTKQLNNEFFGENIRKDVGAMKKLQPVIFMIFDGIEAKNKKSQ